MRTYSLKRLLFIIILFFYTFRIFGQMPDWKVITDKDNNRFFLDKNGRIWTSGKPESDYKPVTIDGIDYYLNQAIDLIKSHYKEEGLQLLKSILSMPDENNAVYSARKTASKELNDFIKREGSRYKKLNENSCLLLFNNENKINLVNDDMLYSIRSVVPFVIISKKVRENTDYKYYGILLGFKFSQIGNYKKHDNNYSDYDLLMAIDSERFKSMVKDSEIIEGHWRTTLGSDTFERAEIEKNKNKIMYSYRDKKSPNYSGFEGFYSKQNYGYYLRAITSAELFAKYKKEILEIVNSFKI